MNGTFSSLPALLELQAHSQWVCWRKEQRKGLVTKVPYDPKRNAHARSNDSATWGSFQEARRALAKKGYTGVGYMFNGDYTGVDLDHCVHQDGRIEEWAQTYLNELKSYAEYSPSGTGIHILVRGVIPIGVRRPVRGTDQGAIEMYCQGRYFTVTGHHVEGTPTTIEECPALQTLHSQITADTTRMAPDDEAVLTRAMLASNGGKLRALWEGNIRGYASASEADLALCSLLAFWTGGDADLLDRLFRHSKLFRLAKWDRPARAGETYGQGTIARAIANRPVHAAVQASGAPNRPQGSDSPPAFDPQFVLDCLRDQEEGDARLFARLFAEKCIYDHTEQAWYIWQGHYWQRDACQQVLLFASGTLADVYVQTSLSLAQQYAQPDPTLTPNLLDQEQHAQHAHSQHVQAMTAALLKRAKDLKKLSRAQAMLTYAQAYLPLTSHRWDSHPWLLGTQDGVLDLRTGLLRNGVPADYIRTVIPTAWKGLDERAPRFERYLREIFADRTESERQSLIDFLQRVLGYGLTGEVSEHLFLMLYGQEGRNGKDTLVSTLHHVLGSSVGPISNEVLVSSRHAAAAGSATPHLCRLQGSASPRRARRSRGPASTWVRSSG